MKRRFRPVPAASTLSRVIGLSASTLAVLLLLVLVPPSGHSQTAKGGAQYGATDGAAWQLSIWQDRLWRVLRGYRFAEDRATMSQAFFDEGGQMYRGDTVEACVEEGYRLADPNIVQYDKPHRSPRAIANLQWANGRFEILRFTRPDGGSHDVFGYIALDRQLRQYSRLQFGHSGSVHEARGALSADGTILLLSMGAPGDLPCAYVLTPEGPQALAVPFEAICANIDTQLQEAVGPVELHRGEGGLARRSSSLPGSPSATSAGDASLYCMYVEPHSSRNESRSFVIGYSIQVSWPPEADSSKFGSSASFRAVALCSDAGVRVRVSCLSPRHVRKR